MNDHVKTEEHDAAPVYPRAEPIESRFLFVDVASRRAKQLRRGAIPGLSDQDEQHDANRLPPRKPERVAMEEVRRHLVLYDMGHNRPSK